MARPRSPSLRFALLLNHVPIWIFSAGLLFGGPFVFLFYERKMDELRTALANGVLSSASLQALSSEVHHIWMLTLGMFLLFALGGSLMALWTYRRLGARLRRTVAYAKRCAQGELGGRLEPTDDGALGDLEQAIVALVSQVRARDAQLSDEARLHRFDARLQRAFELNDSEDDAFEVVARGLGMALGEVSAELLLADPSRAHLCQAAINPAAAAPGCSAESPEQCAAIRRGQTLSFDSSDTLDACPRLKQRGETCAAVCIPVSVMGRTIGVLHATAPPRQGFTDDHIHALRAISTHAGTRIGVLRTLSSTRRQAQRDPLTGMLNRRSFRDAVAVQVRTEAPGAFVMCDLDHFKLLNDTAGHEAGDHALQLFARMVKASVRPGDVAARWGGEEFAMWLPGCDVEQGRAVLMRLRSALKHALSRGTVPGFTFSAGVAAYPAHGSDVDALAREADRALYDAKRDGRDRVVMVGQAATQSGGPPRRGSGDSASEAAGSGEPRLVELPQLPGSRAAG